MHRSSKECGLAYFFRKIWINNAGFGIIDAIYSSASPINGKYRNASSLPIDINIQAVVTACRCVVVVNHLTCLPIARIKISYGNYVDTLFYETFQHVAEQVAKTASLVGAAGKWP